MNFDWKKVWVITGISCLFFVLFLRAAAIRLFPMVLLVSFLGACGYVAFRQLTAAKAPGNDQGASQHPQQEDFTSTRPTAKTEDPVLPGYMKLLQQSNALFLRARMESLSAAIQSGMSGTIELLYELLPLLNHNHPGTELTFVVNKIAGEYFQQVVDSYLRLSDQAKVAQERELSDVLAGLQHELTDIRDLVDQQRIGEFKTHAKFIKTKFFGESIEVA